jgi:hypothetical protein
MFKTSRLYDARKKKLNVCKLHQGIKQKKNFKLSALRIL